MRLKLVEADDEVPETAETPTTEDPSKDLTNTNVGGSLPEWDTLNLQEKVRDFEKYFNGRTPPFNLVKGDKKREFDRRSITDINTYITNVLPMFEKLKNSLTSSIQEQGIKPSDNDFLSFLISVGDNKNIVNNLTEEKAEVIRQQLKNGELDTDSNVVEEWLTNDKAYEGTRYKIQALLLLSDEDGVKNYMDPGDNNENIIDLVKKLVVLTKDEEIRQLLDNAQTRHGESRYKYGKGSKSGNNTTDKEKLVKLATSLGLPEADARKKVDSIFDPKENEASLLHKIALMAAKEKGIDLNSTTPSETGNSENKEK